MYLYKPNFSAFVLQVLSDQLLSARTLQLKSFGWRYFTLKVAKFRLITLNIFYFDKFTTWIITAFKVSKYCIIFRETKATRLLCCKLLMLEVQIFQRRQWMRSFHQFGKYLTKRTLLGRIFAGYLLMMVAVFLYVPTYLKGACS